MTPIVKAQDLRKIYAVDGTRVEALRGVSLTVDEGEFVSVVGPSGSGKSTLLHMLGAMDTPTTGDVQLTGRSLARMSDGERTRLRCREVGFVFQAFNLLPTLSARENVEIALRLAGVAAAKRRARATDLLLQVGLGERARHLPRELSGGERQRVAIARAMANQPALVLADEPTGNLDSQTGAGVVELMRRFNRERGTTFVIITHDDAVARRTDRILVMRDGLIAHEHGVGTPFDEDLAAFRRSGLGRAILSGDESSLAQLGSDEQAWMRQLLERQTPAREDRVHPHWRAAKSLRDAEMLQLDTEE